MKAVVVEKYDSIDNIRLKDVALPEVLAGQVRVRIEAASVGFVDGLKVQGLYQTRDPLPFTPGSEFAGVVDAAAADIRGFAPGTPVMGMARSGGLAEYITVPAAALEVMPDGIAPEVAASFRANYLTSLYALSERAALRPSEYLLVLGAAGGVGIAAVQLGKLLGARVIAAASTEEKREFAAPLRRRRDGGLYPAELARYAQGADRRPWRGRDLRSGGRRRLPAGIPLDRMARPSSCDWLCGRQHPRIAVQSAALERRRAVGR
jgi:NADPH:quinone reductase-like Zn-dependent oxidoreductase